MFRKSEKRHTKTIGQERRDESDEIFRRRFEQALRSPRKWL